MNVGAGGVAPARARIPAKGSAFKSPPRSEYLVKLRGEVEEEDEGECHEEEVREPVPACPEVCEVSRVRFRPESAINRAKSNYADDADDYYDGTLGIYGEHDMMLNNQGERRT